MNRVQFIFGQIGGVLSNTESILIRQPTVEDGMGVFELVKRCKPLDENSSYCNLLQCSHFAQTSASAVVDCKIQGFISGYILPGRPDTLFIWQVAVGKNIRGRGVASRMLSNILARDICMNVRYVETTITDDNRPSWALFEGFAKRCGVELQSSVWMEKVKHFSNQHETENLLRIGPINLPN